jgi:hypothetical protein
VCSQYDDPTQYDAPTRQEQREGRVANGRKMRVTGRGTLLLSALASGQQARKRQVRRTRKGGGK